MQDVKAEVALLSSMSYEDIKLFIEWAKAIRSKTQFDLAVMSHPRMCMTRASMDGQPALYIPLQPVLMFDCLTPDPKLTNRERAICMYRIGELLEKSIMPDSGICDAYFYTNDEPEVRATEKAGWVRVGGCKCQTVTNGVHEPGCQRIQLMRKRIDPKEIPLPEAK